MGCTASGGVQVSPATSSRKKVKDNEPFQPREIQSITKDEISSSHDKTISSIITGIKVIRCPSGMVPIMVLSDLSVPVYLGKLSLLTEKYPTDIKMPIVACTTPLIGRIMCFSSYSMLSQSNFKFDDTYNFYMNCFEWLFENFENKEKILFVDFPEPIHRDIKVCLESKMFQIHFGDFNSDFDDYNCVVILSTANLNDQSCFDKVDRVVKRGAGLACFYMPSETNPFDAPVNKYIQKYGMSYTYCQLTLDSQPSMACRMPKIPKYVTYLTLDTLILKFKKITHLKTKVNVDELDQNVTLLRYHIMVCQMEHMEKILELEQCAWDFMNETGYRSNDNKICPQLYHSIVSILLIDIYNKLPPDKLKPAPDIKLFPGEATNLKLENHKVTIRLLDDALISTGVWCQPGVSATIECKNPPDGVFIQIGSHNLSLISKANPWNRWPVISSFFPLLNGTTTIGSCFGGVVYIAIRKLPENYPRQLELSFHNFSKYPRVVFNKPQVYQMTKDAKTPWCELSSKTVIFTVPSSILEKLQNPDIVFEFIDNFVRVATDNLSYKITRPYRVVFDCEITSKIFVSEYPIYMLIDDINDIFFERDHVTAGLFKFLMAISLASLKDNYFDSETEESLAACVASMTLLTVFKDFDPTTFFDVDLPFLFPALWSIHSKLNGTVILEILKRSQEAKPVPNEVPENKWINFIKQLCSISHYNLAKVLESVKPIPLNLIFEMQQFTTPNINLF